MEKEKQIISHYVSKSLTAPWENENRNITYYSFKQNKILKKNSSRLLTRKGLLTEEEEKYFSKYAEQPFGIFKTKYLNEPDIKDKNVRRAPLVYFYLQFSRFLKVKNPTKASFFKSPYGKDIFTLSDEEIDECVAGINYHFKLVKVSAGEGHAFCYPEVGFFTFPILNPKTHKIYNCFAIPVYLNEVLCLIPKEVESEWINQSREYLHAFSVGMNDENCDFVLMPPLKMIVKTEDLMTGLVEMRKNAFLIQEEMNNLEKKSINLSR